MSVASTSTSGSRPTSRSHDTGFPDSFATHTTSLRHPDAIISPGFTISTEDVDPSRTVHRSKKSVKAKYKRTISHGKIPQRLEQQLTNQSLSVLPSIDSAVDVGEDKAADATGSIGGSSKDDAESIDHREGSIHQAYSPTSHFAASQTSLVDEEHRRSRLFRKWRSQKD